MRTHQIQSGDTLARIAQRYGTTADALARANNISNPDLIQTGRSLVIPDGWEGAGQNAAGRTSNHLTGGMGPAANAPATANTAFPSHRAQDLARTWTNPAAATTPGLVGSTSQANQFHLTQWGPTPYNSGGHEYGFSDCVPTSAAISLSRLGLINHPNADGAASTIDALRDAARGYDTTQSASMGYDTMERGLAQYGASASYLNENDLSQIDAALARGNPVMAAGGPWGAWGAAEEARGNYLNHRDPGAHSVTLLGKTPGGNYIVADPLCSQSTIEVSPDKLRQFFADGGANSGAMEVKRADGQAAPGVGGPSTPSSPSTPAPSTPSSPSTPNSGTPGPSTAGRPPQVELERGMYSGEVQQLQNVLVDMGFMTREQVATGPGTFGPQTQAGVDKLQDFLIGQGLMSAEQKATGPGRYGPVTRGALNTYLERSSSPTPSQPAPSQPAPSQPAPTPTTPSQPAPSQGSPAGGQLSHLDGINPPADNTSARPYWANYVKDEVMPRLQQLGVDPQLVKDAVWFGLSEGIYTIANNPGYKQANGTQPQSPIGFSNFADSHNWEANSVNGQTAFPPGLPYGNYGWRSGNWQVGIAGAQVTDAVDSGNLVKAFKQLYGNMSPEELGQKMLGLIGEGQRDFPNLSIEQLATRDNQQWAAVLLRDPMINVLVQTMNPAIRGPHGYGADIVRDVFG